jgi:ABC-type branched-subunit amino acid transport system substrate-binding protein
LLVALGTLPFLYRTLPQAAPMQLTKIALLVAFSGQMQARGNDLYAAVDLALQRANAHAGRTIAVVSALDDQAQPQTAQDQARGAAADPAIDAMVCCTTSSAEHAVAAILPPGKPLVSLAATAPGMAVDEAMLVRRRLGGSTAVVVSDQTIPGEARAGALMPAFRAAGYTVSLQVVDFAGGSLAGRIAVAVAQETPDLIVVDADYPSAATLATALRGAGVTAPLVGDDRLDGAPAAALLNGDGPVWYVALDRVALLQQVPTTFVSDFSQLRGHPPSARDILAYVQASAAVHDGLAFVHATTVPVVLYQLIPGVYPAPPVGTVGGGSP